MLWCCVRTWTWKNVKQSNDIKLLEKQQKNIVKDAVKNGITEWILKWKENGWKNSNKEPVKNKDLWEKLDNLCEQNTINWKWVKGHSNNKYNNLADELATEAIKN